MEEKTPTFVLIIVCIHVELAEPISNVVHLTGALAERLGYGPGPGSLINILCLCLRLRRAVEFHVASIIILVSVAPGAGYRLRCNKNEIKSIAGITAGRAMLETDRLHTATKQNSSLLLEVEHAMQGEKEGAGRRGSLSAQGEGLHGLGDLLLRGRVGDDGHALGGAPGHPGYGRDHPLERVLLHRMR